MTQRTVVVLITAAMIFAAAIAGQADDALRWKIKQLQAELNRLQAQTAAHAQVEAELENERRQKDAARQSLASVQQQLRDAQASMVRGQERDAALQQDLSQAQQQLAQAEAESARLSQGAQQALASVEEELASTQSALAEEQERHRNTGGILAGVRQALEQASAAVVKQRWAQNRQNQAHGVAQAALQADLLEAQQRQWQAEADAVSLRQELSQANAAAAGLQAQVASAQSAASGSQEALATARQQLADLRAALAEEQRRYGAAAQVLSGTQQALAEKQLELDGVSRVAAVRQGMLASVQQQLRDAQTTMVQDQERQAGLEQTLAQTQQDLSQANAAAEQAQDETARQAQMNEARQAQMNRDLMEARGQGDATQLILASVREELARTRRTLEQEQQRNAAQGSVLANTQAALSETSGSLAEVRTAMAEQTEAHASAQAAAQSDKRQWVERYWDMERKSNETRVALRREEQAHQGTQQALDQATRQARLDGIRQSQLSRDVMEARQALDLMRRPVAHVKPLVDSLWQRFADEIQQNQASVRVDEQDVKLVSADIFDFVKAVELGSRSVQTLDRLVEVLQKTPWLHVRFQVHTDSIPVRRGSRWPTNWELSTARAAKLVRYLIDKGVAGERLSIGGYGEYRPVADNSTPEGRRQNRRVEVIIKAPILK